MSNQPTNNRAGRYVFGVINRDGVLIDTSRTARGAKAYATRHGYDKIGARHVDHYYAQLIAEKRAGVWHDLDPLAFTGPGFSVAVLYDGTGAPPVIERYSNRRAAAEAITAHISNRVIGPFAYKLPDGSTRRGSLHTGDLVQITDATGRIIFEACAV